MWVRGGRGIGTEAPGLPGPHARGVRNVSLLRVDVAGGSRAWASAAGSHLAVDESNPERWPGAYSLPMKISSKLSDAPTLVVGGGAAGLELVARLSRGVARS